MTQVLAVHLSVNLTPGDGVLPYMGNIGMFGPKGYNSFLVVFVRNRTLILAILVSNRVWYLHSSLELDMFLRRRYPT